MKKLMLLLFVFASAGAGYMAYNPFARALFSVSGTISMTPRLEKYAVNPNIMCYVVVRNSGDVPVAIKRYVNPQFPLKYEIKAEDFILKDAWKEPLKAEVQINTHGEAGTLKAGDMFSDKIKIASHNIDISVSKVMGMPTLLASEDKARFLFTSAAR